MAQICYTVALYSGKWTTAPKIEDFMPPDPFERESVLSSPGEASSDDGKLNMKQSKNLIMFALKAASAGAKKEGQLTDG